MSFKTIIGQALAVQLIQRWLSRQTTQPLVFYGPDGAIKRTLALEAAKALNCEKAGAEGCAGCLSCRKIDSGNHPDVRIVDLAYQAAQRGEPIEKQLTLKIETILEERKRLYQTAHEGKWKVSLIDDAHKMTPDASNVLLKVLEEPPAKTAIFLLTPYRDRLLTTILSRCQVIRFRTSEDSAGKSDEQMKDVEALWAKLPDLTPGQILGRPEGRSKSASNRNDIEAQIQRLLSPALRELRSGDLDAVRKVEWIQQAQQQLRQNVPPTLVYDHLLLKLSQTAQ
jgi:DNA polymerase III subunit delta'